MKVEETSPVRGVKIKLSGRMDLYWRKVEGGNTIEFAEIEEYLDDKYLYFYTHHFFMLALLRRTPFDHHLWSIFVVYFDQRTHGCACIHMVENDKKCSKFIKTYFISSCVLEAQIRLR